MKIKKAKECHDYLRVYYNSRRAVEIRRICDLTKISADHLAELSKQLSIIAEYAKKPLVSQTTDIHYSWYEFK